MQGCRIKGYEGCKYKDAGSKDTWDRGCRPVNIPRSLVAPTRGAGGYIHMYMYIYIYIYICRFVVFGRPGCTHCIDLGDVHVHDSQDVAYALSVRNAYSQS